VRRTDLEDVLAQQRVEQRGLAARDHTEDGDMDDAAIQLGHHRLDIFDLLLKGRAVGAIQIELTEHRAEARTRLIEHQFMRCKERLFGRGLIG